jgi:hypothetical protein
MSIAELGNGYFEQQGTNYGLGSLSDCFARCPDTSVEVTEQVIVYKTKTRPDYWFGNYIVSNSPVTSESLPAIRNQCSLSDLLLLLNQALSLQGYGLLR